MENGGGILLFGRMGETGPTVLKDLEGHNLEVDLVDFPQEVFRDEPGYRRELLKAIKRLKPDVVIPIGDSLAMSRFKTVLSEQFPEITVCVEDEQKVAVLNSKVRCWELADRLGIRQPRVFNSPSDIPEGVKVVFKRDVSYCGHGVHMPVSREALMNLIAHQRKGERYLIEEFVSGADWSMDAIRMGGVFMASSYRCSRSGGLCGPATERTVSYRRDLEDTAHKIMGHMDYNGICGFDFIISEDGQPYMLECNPRFTGGLKSQIEAGFDIPYILLKLNTT